jgi:hypothetical protein
MKLSWAASIYRSQSRSSWWVRISAFREPTETLSQLRHGTWTDWNSILFLAH